MINKKYKNRKIAGFIILSLFIIVFLLPWKIEAFTSKKKVQDDNVKIFAFSFPNLNMDRDISKINFISLIWNNKMDFKSKIMKSEINFLKDNNEISKSVFNNEIIREDENKSDIKDEDLFSLNENSIEKFKDNITEKEIIIKEDENFKNSAYKNKKRSSKPQILIYHSHTREGYAPGSKQNEDTNYNVCGAGDVLTEILEKQFNINVIHDKTIHDVNYTKSYSKSGVTVDQYLKTYRNFDLIIDLHRDSIDKKEPVTCKINGKNAAKYMFVVTTDNPNYTNQKNTIDKLISISNKNYPGMLRGNGIYPYKKGTGYFNQQKNPNMILIELGAFCNTADEGKTTAKYLGQIIAEYLKTK